MPHTNEQRREHYKKNRAKICAKQREYKNKHRKQITAWQKKYHKKWYADNRDAIILASKKYRERTRSSIEHLKRRLLAFAKCRAKRNNIPFDLSLDDISIPTKCPVFGTPFILDGKRKEENIPSLDKFLPKLGYVKGNVAVISLRANTLKRDASLDELKKLTSYVRRITHKRGCA